MLPLVLLRIVSGGVVSYLVTLPAPHDRVFVGGYGEALLATVFLVFLLFDNLFFSKRRTTHTGTLLME